MVDLKEEIRKFILETFPVARKNKITEDSLLLETGIIDSLGVIEVVNFLIEQLGIELEEEDLTMENFATIVSIVNLIEQKRNDN